VHRGDQGRDVHGCQMLAPGWQSCLEVGLNLVTNTCCRRAMQTEGCQCPLSSACHPITSDSCAFPRFPGAANNNSNTLDTLNGKLPGDKGLHGLGSSAAFVMPPMPLPPQAALAAAPGMMPLGMVGATRRR
jgi:hypothetical protein